MTHLRLTCAAFLAVTDHGCGIGTPDGDRPEPPPLSGDRILADLRTLSSDDFLGRGPGQPGGDMAVRFIAEQFEAAGLEPVEGSWTQAVPMVGTTSIPTSVRLAFRGEKGPVEPAYLDDFVLNAGDPVGDPMQVDAELVFAGYGIDAPENDWNDFEGQDVRGKVLLSEG